ncbi:MAG: hypothetical protein ACRDQA_04725 [Nocardioidaceae bacterium]
MKKALSLASIALIAATSLTACGGDDDTDSSSGGDYCSIYQSADDQLGDLEVTTLSDQKFEQVRDKMDQLREAAPTDKLEQDWTKSGQYLDDFQGALEDAGISFDQLQQLANDKMPEGVDPAKIQELAKTMQKLTQDSSMQDAQDHIQADVKSRCGIDVDSDS